MSGLLPGRELRVALAAALLAGSWIAAKAAELPALAASTSDVTVSGISSGAYMAVQFHFVYSGSVAGVGALAGGPYECAGGSSWNALTRCMAPSTLTPLPNAGVFRQRPERRAATGAIDALAGLQGDRVWIFSGGRDETVERPVVDALLTQYRNWLPADAVHLETREDAGHAMISVEDAAANPCPSTETPYINRCGELDAAGELLQHLLGPLQPKQEPPPGRLTAFDQRPFMGPQPAASGLAEQGYVFVPESCSGGGCRVHVAFHGCRQTTEQIGTRFVDNAGYIEWAQTNRLVVLFPQVVPRYGWGGGFTWVFNPRGCWDWWGYTGPQYATRDGLQIRAVKAMIDRLGEAGAAGR